jgi:predicted DNA binding CopG/RHH family protein
LTPKREHSPKPGQHSDIEAAKAIAEKMGIGYQTVLKEIISKGLRRVS